VTRPYAFTEGRKRAIDDVVAEVERYDCSLVEVTGGEPLLQEAVYPLMDQLLARGKTVLLETGGHRSTARVPDPVVTILDIKCPASGESERMDWDNLGRLRPRDEVKFVINDRADYEYARAAIVRHESGGPCRGNPHVARPRCARSKDAVRMGAGRFAAGARAAATAQVHLAS
jgi:7-carboxy-7-deazaguanine synthase